MRVWNHIALAGFSVLSLVACTSTSPTVQVVDQQLIPAGTAYSLVRVSEDGPGMAFVRLNGPAAKAVQAMSHRWLATDIFEYRLILEAANASGDYVALDPAVSLTVSNKQAYPAAAAFSGLKAGVKYRLRLEAWGNDGGTAPASHMNSLLASTAVMDLTGDTIETHFMLNMQVKLDPQVYSGAADVAIDPPADATPAEDPDATPEDEATTATEPAGLTFLDDSTDVIGFGSYGADGSLDGHFKLVVDLPADTQVQRIHVTEGPWGGLFDSMNTNGWSLVGIFQNGNAVNTTVGSAVGTYTGPTTFDIYLPEPGWYNVADGHSYTAHVIDVNGNTVAQHSFSIQ